MSDVKLRYTKMWQNKAKRTNSTNFFLKEPNLSFAIFCKALPPSLVPVTTASYAVIVGQIWCLHSSWFRSGAPGVDLGDSRCCGRRLKTVMAHRSCLLLSFGVSVW